MITVTTHEAKTHLSRILAAIENGEEYIIARGRKPIARLVPWREPPGSARPKVGESMDRPMHVPEAALKPLSRQELRKWGL